MALRLPGMAGQRGQQAGPQAGPEPAWARFARTGEGVAGGARVSLHAYKPDITAYRVLGREPGPVAAQERGGRERNSYNSSVYVSHASHYLGKSHSALTRLPVIGEIAAGQYDVTVALQEYDCLDHDGGVMIEKALARGGAYALRVRGTSMTHVGIEPGDLVIVAPQSWANDGDFVIANYTGGAADGSEGLATLKRFYKRRDHIFLQSATANTAPIRLFPGCRTGSPDRDTVKVQGIVTMIVKTN